MIGSLLARVVDRGAITAAFVGIGMAVTIGISFLLVIPVEPVYWLLAIPAGLLIGYYANARSGRLRGQWGRIVANAIFAGAATGLTLALLLVGVKALFFAADDGYRDPGLGGRITCQTGGDCVFHRYLEDQPEALAAAGVTDAATFSTYYWAQQLATGRLLVLLATGAGLAGGLLFGLTRPDPSRVRTAGATGAVAAASPAAAEAPAETTRLPATPGPAGDAAPSAERDDLQLLGDTLLATAGDLLGRQRGFLPFGASVAADGTLGLLGALAEADATAREGVAAAPVAAAAAASDATALRALLVNGLRAQAASGQIRASGICTDSTFRPQGGDATDAISMVLEHRDGDVLVLVAPYRRDATGTATVGDVIRLVPDPAEVFAPAG